MRRTSETSRPWDEATPSGSVSSIYPLNATGKYGNVTFTANWSANEYTITFNLNDQTGSTEARLIVDRRFVANSSGVAPFKDDGRLRVVAPETRAMTLGELFDRAENPAEEKPESPSQLKLAAMGKTVAAGYFGQVASSPAFIVESAGF